MRKVDEWEYLGMIGFIIYNLKQDYPGLNKIISMIVEIVEIIINTFLCYYVYCRYFFTMKSINLRLKLS